MLRALLLLLTFGLNPKTRRLSLRKLRKDSLKGRIEQSVREASERLQKRIGLRKRASRPQTYTANLLSCIVLCGVGLDVQKGKAVLLQIRKVRSFGGYSQQKVHVPVFISVSFRMEKSYGILAFW